jgi:signal transduction histidine kinase
VAEGPGLAHDAGNLLSALGLYSELLQRPGVLRPQYRHYARELQSLSERSSVLIRRLLTNSWRSGVEAAPLGEPASNDRSAEPSSAEHLCDGPSTLEAMLPLLRSLAAPRARVLLHTLRNVVWVPCPAEALDRIVANLVRNAAQAFGEQTDRAATQADAPCVTLRLKAERGATVLEVEDNGPGMPPAIAAAFLRPTALPPGTQRGLGHRIVHELAAASGGRLEITVRPANGTTVRLVWSAAVVAAARVRTGHTC